MRSFAASVLVLVLASPVPACREGSTASTPAGLADAGKGSVGADAAAAAPTAPDGAMAAASASGVAPDAAVVPAPPTGAEPCPKMTLADACVSAALHESADREGWFTARGAKAPTTDLPEDCHEITVGQAKEAALACSRIAQPASGPPGAPTHAFRAAYDRVVYVVRARRPVVVFERRVAFDVFDKEQPFSGPLFALKIDLPATAETIVLEEPAPGACAAAQKRTAADVAKAAREPVDTRGISLAWARLDDQLVKRLCENVGRYVWRGNTFVREGVPAAPRISGPGTSGP